MYCPEFKVYSIQFFNAYGSHGVLLVFTAWVLGLWNSEFCGSGVREIKQNPALQYWGSPHEEGKFVT